MIVGKSWQWDVQIVDNIISTNKNRDRMHTGF